METTNEARHPLLIDLLENVLGDSAKHHPSHGQIAFNCPMCAEIKDVDVDNKYNLEVNYGKGVYNCWSCGKTHNTRGTIYDLVNSFGSGDQLRLYQRLGMVYEYISKDGDEIKRSDKPVHKPNEYISLADKEIMGVYGQAYRYLNERGITNDIIKKHNIGWAPQGKYEGRIILPSVNEEDDWDYYTTRAIDKYTKPKYLNCDAEKEGIVFNVDLIDWDKWVFIVEGPFDHIVTPNSIPMLGKGLYPLLHDTIYENANSRVIVLTDPDAVNDGINIYRQLDGGKLLGKVLINFMPKFYDPAKYFEKFGLEAYKKQLIDSRRLED